ncbi:MAG: hypothetical protein MZU84_03855 [Sphingobacterium sp.]|nr:hypothetical protein [Sphingobacterium sp.]
MFIAYKGIPRKRYFKINIDFDLSKLDKPKSIKHMLKNNLNEFKDSYDDYKLKEIKKTVDYYLDFYSKNKGFEHPKIRKGQFYDVIENLISFQFSNDLAHEHISAKLIAKYFSANLETDHNIIHFSQPEIFANRLF